VIVEDVVSAIEILNCVGVNVQIKNKVP